MPIAYPDAITTPQAAALMSQKLKVPFAEGDMRAFARWYPGVRLIEGGRHVQYLSRRRVLELAEILKDGPKGGNLTGRGGHRRYGQNVIHRDAFEAGAQTTMPEWF